jgi:aminoglycoside phosphotransferase (APT) family kinase protein
MKGIQQANLETYFESEIEGAKAPLSFSLIQGGHSNLTYLVEDALGRKRVLRRPPTGAVLATAHDMGREHRILTALGGSKVPVPETLALCLDDAVNDAPFYVMDFVEGAVLSDPDVVHREVPEANRRALGMNVIEVLAHLHNIEPDDVGLGDLGRREAYLSRQLKRWKTQWEKSKTRELGHMEEAHRILESRMPEQQGSSIVHGDYRFGNFLSDGANAKLRAVLDWELCTLGDPLADVGYLMNDWNQPNDIRPSAGGASPSPTTCGGFPSREEMLAEYEKRTGNDTSRVDYYRAFQYWRLAAIVEGVLSRYKKGVMGNEANTDLFERQVNGLAQSAVDLLHKGDPA